MNKNEIEVIHWTVVCLQGSDFVLAATEQGLGYLQFQEGNAAEGVDQEAWQQLNKWARKMKRQTSLIKDSEDNEVLMPYIQQLDEYLTGKRSEFSLPLDLRGTEFQQGVWSALNDIAYGETVSYSQVAESLGKSNAVRAVGTTIGANPVLIVVPCHRVVGKNGALTGYRGGVVNKEKLLKLER